LSESTVPSGESSSSSSTGGSTAVALSQYRSPLGCSATSSDTASPRTSLIPAVSAAPTVPECSTARPTFAPWLIPDSTTSGAGSNHPLSAATTMCPGWASTAHVSMPSSPGSSRRVTTVRPSRRVAVSAALAPLDCSAGAATITSRPADTAAAAKACRPGESMPSSLVTRARGTRLVLPAGGFWAATSEVPAPAAA
jgi:hypothetical protein